MNDTSNSIFWKEIFEQPEAVANCLAANREAVSYTHLTLPTT